MYGVCLYVCMFMQHLCALGILFSWCFSVFSKFCALNTVLWVGALSGSGCCKDSEDTNRGIKQDFCQCILRKMRLRVLERNTRNMLFCKCKGGVYWWWGLHTHQSKDLIPLKKQWEQFWVSEHRGEWMEVVLAENYFSHSKVDWVVGRVIWHKTLSLHIWLRGNESQIKLVVIKTRKEGADGSKNVTKKESELEIQIWLNKYHVVGETM